MVRKGLLLCTTVMLAGVAIAADAGGRARVYSASSGQALTAPSSAQPATVVADFLRARGLGRAADELRLVQSSRSGGFEHVQLQQEVSGLRVFGAYVKATVDARGGLVHVIESLAPSGAVQPARASEAQALAAALRSLGYATPRSAEVARQGRTVTFERVAGLYARPSVERVAFVSASGRLEAGFLVETWSTKQNLLHETLVDGSARVVSSELRTAEDSYNVFVEDPLKGAQGVIAGPGAGNAQSPIGWLGTGAQTTTHISGNNANAYLDVDSNNKPDRGGSAVTTGDFLTAVDLTQAPSTTGNRAVAVQNLFYLNNVVHDILYGHGFTEAAGNFQEDNFGKGGAGSDSVLAEAQDGGGTDNANFATPRDGRNPRMQMYLWSGAGPDHEVRVNSPVQASYGASGAAFGPALDTTGLTGDVVLVNDGAGTTSDGCEGAQAAVSGKIALVDRGTCNFTVKVENAQAAGAIAVIVANNVGTSETFTMGGTSHKVRIPAVMIGYSDGGALKAIGAPNATVRKSANPPLMIDASLDADVVFHEYGHGLSWRMIGSMSGPLSGAIGEGASDGLALLIDGDDVMGEYSSSNANGIRRYPYAGYPLTYGSVTGAEVHDDGEIYAAIVWRLKELYEANGLTADQLLSDFVDGMNYTPAGPAYEDMRDGILASVANRGGNTCLVWQAFGQYGVGVGASGTVSNSGAVTIVESFTLPTTCP